MSQRVPWLHGLLSLALVFAVAALPSHAQKNLSGAAEIRQSLDRLNVLGSVLMIAAHPDDENTALIAYFARGRKCRAGYLSLTRGEGGQNLIGSEQGDEMGVIRTQELLAARRIDGGEQFFTRAIDFGFSKTAAETLDKWKREEILGDIVRVIREFRPDVIVLRFSGTPRDGHGQHQASAMLGKEAFAAAADPARFPEQLTTLQPWQAKRVVWNVFAFTPQQEKEARDLPNRVSVDTGEYDPILGYSYGEIAGMSRSQHRSQAMGAPERKGAQPNALVHVAGEPAQKDLLDGVDTTWNRVPGGAAIGQLLAAAAREFRMEDPAASVPRLLEARRLLEGRSDFWSARKRAELEETIALAAGLWFDVSAARPQAVPGHTTRLNLQAVNRSRLAARLASVTFEGAPGVAPITAAKDLPANQPVNLTADWAVPANLAHNQPFWLAQPKDGALYTVPPAARSAMAGPIPVLRARARFEIAGQTIEVTRPVQHRFVDRGEGELTRPLEVVPPVALTLAEKSLIFPNRDRRGIDVQVRANLPKQSGTVRLDLPPGWSAQPPTRPFILADIGEEATVSFEITPAQAEGRGKAVAVAALDGRELSAGQLTIRYPHIPPQTLFPRAEADVVRVNATLLSRRIAYVMGAGDDVPAALRQLGAEVSLLNDEDLARADLSRFDAIVTGVRAYNTRAALRANQQRLFDFVRAGGAMVVQYNVLEGGFMGGDPKLLEKVGPHPMKIGRERVTVEEAPVTYPDPRHFLLRTPNELRPSDFEGWVQERGLYFATEWDPQYEPLFESHDPGEGALKGGTLVTRLGKGVYVFTAYSWFRQLPAGVPGAYRIFANLVSAAKAGQP